MDDMQIPDVTPPRTRQEAIEQARNMVAFWNRRIMEVSFSKKWNTAGHGNELPGLDEMQKQLARWENKLALLENRGERTMRTVLAQD